MDVADLPIRRYGDDDVSNNERLIFAIKVVLVLSQPTTTLLYYFAFSFSFQAILMSYACIVPTFVMMDKIVGPVVAAVLYLVVYPRKPWMAMRLEYSSRHISYVGDGVVIDYFREEFEMLR